MSWLGAVLRTLVATFAALEVGECHGPSRFFVLHRPGPRHGARAGAEPGPTVVWLTGEHDISTDGALSQVLARAMALGATALVIDLSELGFIGASTLGPSSGPERSSGAAQGP